MKKLTSLIFAACMATSLCVGPVAAAGPSGAAQLIAKGDQLATQGKLADAQKSYETALKADPRSVDAYMKVAGVQIAQNDFGAAIKTYKDVIGLDPNNAKAFIGLGIAYLHSGDKSLTKAALEEALRLEPKRKEQLGPIMAMLDESPKNQSPH
jgi:Tfp pilus assembly protein PilF